MILTFEVQNGEMTHFETSGDVRRRWDQINYDREMSSNIEVERACEYAAALAHVSGTGITAKDFLNIEMHQNFLVLAVARY